MNGRREEHVVLLDDGGKPAGSMPKTLVHHANTPLHLGFSCYLFDRTGRLLVTRRAMSKRTWPGVWTNSCCGHPAPDESAGGAVRRRVREELALGIDTPTCLLPRFRYAATAPDGTMENELCPVFCARADGPVQADATEVMDWCWVPWSDFVAAAALRWPISPWAADQVPQLAAAPGFSRWTEGG